MTTKRQAKTRGAKVPKWRRDHNWERAFRTQATRAGRLHLAMTLAIETMTAALAVPNKAGR
jgi:hypothetical protein